MVKERVLAGNYALHLFERLRWGYAALESLRRFHDWQINRNRQ